MLREATALAPNLEYVLDVSLFTSRLRAKEGLQLLRTAVGFEASTRFIVAAKFLHELKRLEQNEVSDDFVHILKGWLGPPYSDDHVEEIALGLSVDEDYQKTLSQILGEFNLVSTDKVVGNQERIGEQTIEKKDLLDRLGSVVGSVFFDMLAASQRLKAAILSFGDRLTWIAGRVQLRVRYAKSEFKSQLKKHSEVKLLLRLVGIAMTLKEVNEFVQTLGLPREFTNHLGTIGVGVAIVADG